MTDYTLMHKLDQIIAQLEMARDDSMDEDHSGALAHASIAYTLLGEAIAAKS